MKRWGLLLALLSGCASANPNVGWDIGQGLFAGVVSATAERTTGGCFSICANDTVCNGATGLCDPLPCRVRCGVDERCVNDDSGEHCEGVTTGPRLRLSDKCPGPDCVAGDVRDRPDPQRTDGG